VVAAAVYDRRFVFKRNPAPIERRYKQGVQNFASPEFGATVISSSRSPRGRHGNRQRDIQSFVFDVRRSQDSHGLAVFGFG
jgi:hypothetical protein